MDGTPIFNMRADCLPGCKILGFEGILNTTTNFVLAEMERGRSRAEAVAEAQRQGFAERDPSMDLDGTDAAVKVAVLLNTLLGASVCLSDIEREGILGVAAEEVQQLAAQGLRYKLVCRGELVDGRPVGSVRLQTFPADALFASVRGTSSVLTLHTDLMRSFSLFEHEPGLRQTSYGVYSDILNIVRSSGGCG